MTNKAKTIRREFRAALKTQDFWEKQRRNNKRLYTKEYYFASGQAHAIYELAQALNVKLYDENIKLIED